MPELPEVETVVRLLRAKALPGKKIVNTHILWSKTLAIDPSLLTGQTIRGCERLGKWIIITLDSGQDLLIHLRMSGKLFLSDQLPPSSHIRVYFTLDDARFLIFQDTRKFGRMILCNHAKTYLATLGQDPLDPLWDKQNFAALIQKSQKMIKPLLLDQKVIAGLGNIYVDEVLFRTKISPLTKSSTLSTAQIDKLIVEIPQVLQEAIINQGSSLGSGASNFHTPEQKLGTHQHKLLAYGRVGRPCLACTTPLEKIKVAQRGTTYCPVCQTIANH